MEPTTLSTERLLLRPLESGDIDAVYAACQDPEIARWTTVPYAYTRERAVDFVEKINPDGWREDTMYNFGVFTRDGGALVGSMGLLRLQQLAAPQRQAELGYWTVKEQRGKGYTVEAARAVCDWAFDALGVERIEWYRRGRQRGLAGGRAQGRLRAWRAPCGRRSSTRAPGATRGSVRCCPRTGPGRRRRRICRTGSERTGRPERAGTVDRVGAGSAGPDPAGVRSDPQVAAACRWGALRWPA